MTATTADVGRRRAWVMAARPQTLPAGVSPVIVGTGLATIHGVLAPLPAIAALVGAVLIQIGTNFANDYYDAVKGTDTADRDGFTRVTASGLIEPGRVKRAMILTYLLALLVGTYLVYVGGVPIVVVGLSAIVAGILYTGGPHPYGYRGLGDLFVFVYFGLVAVTGTYYVQAVASAPDVGVAPLWIPPGTVPLEAIVASLPPACLATCILLVNNLRDLETDAAAGKRTLAVMIGYRWSRVEFLALLAVAYLVPVYFVVGFGYDVIVFLPLSSLPLAYVVATTILRNTVGSTLNRALEQTGRLLFVYSVLFAMAFVLEALL